MIFVPPRQRRSNGDHAGETRPLHTHQPSPRLGRVATSGAWRQQERPHIPPQDRFSLLYSYRVPPQPRRRHVATPSQAATLRACDGDPTPLHFKRRTDHSLSRRSLIQVSDVAAPSVADPGPVAFLYASYDGSGDRRDEPLLRKWAQEWNRALVIPFWGLFWGLEVPSRQIQPRQRPSYGEHNHQHNDRQHNPGEDRLCLGRFVVFCGDRVPAWHPIGAIIGTFSTFFRPHRRPVGVFRA